MAPARVAGPVAEFVQEGLIIALRAGELGGRRQDDPIVSQVVTGLVAGFVATVHAAGPEHTLDPVVDRPGRSVPVPAWREEQALGLLDVEKSGRALYRAILRRRALRRLGIKIPGREAEDARLVLGNPAPGGFDPGPGAPARVRVSLLDGPAEKMQSMDPGRRAAGKGNARARSGPWRGSVVAKGLGGSGAGGGSAGRRTPGAGGARGVGVVGARACESHLSRERGSGNRISWSENTPRRKPLSGSSLGAGR